MRTPADRAPPHPPLDIPDKTFSQGRRRMCELRAGTTGSASETRGNSALLVLVDVAALSKVTPLHG